MAHIQGSGVVVSQTSIPQSGAAGAAGSAGTSLVLNILGGTRTIIYDQAGANPAPAMTEFSYELYENGLLVTPDEATWSVPATDTLLSGAKNGARFSPTVAATFDPASGDNHVTCAVTYSGQLITQTVPIAMTKVGATGDPGANGADGTNGTDGYSAFLQYSTDGSGTGGGAWHDTQTVSDNFMRSGTGSSAADITTRNAWGPAGLIIGVPGTNGTDGGNGTNGTNGSNGTNGNYVAVAYLLSESASPSAPADATNGPIPTGWQGTPYSRVVWATSTAYAHDQRVNHEGTIYNCDTAHTSGTFATDLAAAKWSAVTGEKLWVTRALCLADNTTVHPHWSTPVPYLIVADYIRANVAMTAPTITGGTITGGTVRSTSATIENQTRSVLASGLGLTWQQWNGSAWVALTYPTFFGCNASGGELQAFIDGKGLSVGKDGIVACATGLTAGNIAAGHFESDHQTANAVEPHAISFGKTFASAPYVVATPESAAPQVVGIGVTDVTTTGFNVQIWRTDTNLTHVSWIAIGA